MLTSATSSPSTCAGCERHPKRALVLTLWHRFLAGVVNQHLIGRLHSLGVVLSVVMQGQSCLGTTREQERLIAKSERRGAAGEPVSNGEDSSVEVDVGPPIS